MVHARYRFELVVASTTGSVVHREGFTDFGPLYEDLLFSAVLSGAVPNDGTFPPASAAPLFRDDDPGRLAGLTVSLGPVTRRYGLSVMVDRVRAAPVERALLEDDSGGEITLDCWLEAHARDDEPAPGRRAALRRSPYPFSASPLSAFGIVQGSRAPASRSVFVRRDVLEDLREHTARSFDVERADILVGHLVRTVERGAVVVVTGRIPARTETGASRTHFAFSPLTFAAASREAAQRNDGSVPVGWSHNHPPACAGACRGAVAPCAASTLFFSADDRAVHRASFLAPYMIALVMGKEAHQSPDVPGVRAFGWRDAAIAEHEVQVFSLAEC